MPSRERGIARFQALLDATESLLKTQTPDAVGLYQIAEKAGVPPASVYHFFPTKEAAFFAVAQKFFDGLPHYLNEPIDARLLRGWQDVLSIELKRLMDFHNQHPPATKVMYGGYGGVDTRNINALIIERSASAQYDRLNSIFHMPHMKDPTRKFENRIAIMDGIWTISVRKHGQITQAYYEDAVNACAAYTRLFLPEYLEPRDVLLQAAARGDTVRLDYPTSKAEQSGPETRRQTR